MQKFQWYQYTLESQDDSQIPDEPCTSKATIYTACMAAGHVGAGLRRIITGRQGGGILTHDILQNNLRWFQM
jgi:hypothetical protein